MKILKKILLILSPVERKRAGLVLFMILTMAFLDMMGVASIMPFMAVLGNPEVIETNTILNTAFNASYKLGITTPEQFMFALGIFVFVMLVITLSVKALTTFAQTRFVFMREYSIGKRLVDGYLHQSYSWFLTRNSADLGKNILSEVSQVITFALGPIANIIASGAIIFALLLLLVVVDPKLAITIGLVLGFAYGLVFKFTGKLLSRIGEERIAANEARFIALNEGFGAAKEVKVGSLEHIYIQRFAKPAKTYSKHMATATIIANLPRFALELIAFGGMLLVILYLMSKSGNFANALPIISLYALAGYRLMPSLQQLYSSATQLRFAGAALDALLRELDSIQPLSPKAAETSNTKELTFEKSIELNNVTFHYPSVDDAAIKNINLTIAANSKVGFVGPTGSGKTSTVDLILGLLEAQSGALKIDGRVINNTNRRSWQSLIGYVPQHIYLSDDSVEANIAFGISADEIDQTVVEHVAKIADLHEFVVTKLPNKYKTKVGERGVRLSGGQRQRIGIARALYRNPKVLILDEATSALDNLTEQSVMKAVHNLGQDITVIMIAHRLSTVKECDTIFFLENGELTGQGSFDELLISNERFKAMNKT
jgi:ATP-binding cassette, subfamily B, bacterial PglK